MKTADFENKVVLITGAVGNLGSAVASAFATAGAKLALTDHSSGRLDASFDTLSPDEHLFLNGIDVTDETSVAAMVEQTAERFGHIDVLVNTVGGYRAGAPVHETALETWDRMLNLNARSVFVVSRAVIPHLLEQGSGHIINVSARAALSGGKGTAAYSSAKSAVIRLTESMAAELKDKGINVNCVLPGTIDTPQNRQARPSADASRWVTPESLAQVILFLASPEANDIHGAALPVRGAG